MKEIKCVGCDTQIPWDGTGILSYTCPCGATIFYDETGRWFLPARLIMALAEGRELPHLDYLVGESDHTSFIKEKLIEELREKGAIWVKECEQCRQRKLEWEKKIAVFEAEMIVKKEKLLP